MLVEQFGSVDAFAFEYNQRDAFNGGNVFEGIAVNHKKIGVVARMD
jgi:hypothetical protein